MSLAITLFRRFSQLVPATVSLCICLWIAPSVYALTYTVTNTNDSGAGSLRQAILDANANIGLDTIAFSIGGGGVQTIQPTSVLPDVTDPVIIDGTTQPGFSSSPIVEINGTLVSSGDENGLTIASGNSTIRGLVINRFASDGIEIEIAGGNTVEGCYIGTDVSGTVARPNGYGISVKSNGNVIGGTTAAQRNVLSGNTNWGIGFYLSAANNTVQGNYIGVDADGTGTCGNSGNGVELYGGAANNTIGGTATGEGNVIAYNGGDGVDVSGGATGNQISGNSIFNNTGLGIDLDGAGANNDKAAPAITSITPTGSDFTVVATVTSGDTIELFRANNAASPAVTPDGSGYGEGYLFLGSCVDNGSCSGPHISAVADADPTAGTVQATLLSSGLDVGDYVSATATDSSNNTSEFSANMQPAYIEVDCDFSDWSDGEGIEFVIDDQGGPDDWGNPKKLDITQFGVASNLSDSFYILYGFDEVPASGTAALLIDIDLDDNINFALAVTVDGGSSTVELYTCDNSLPYGCGSATLSKTYNTPQDYCVGTAPGPWNTDTFVEIALPYDDLGAFTGGSVILAALNSYNQGFWQNPKDSIFEDYYDRILYDTDDGTGQIIDDAGTPSISGTVYSDEGTTSIGIGKTVRLLVNGLAAGTGTTNAVGDYFIVAPASAGDTIVVYIDDDATYQGTTVTVFDGIQLNDLDIYAGHCITRHDNGGSLSNAHMATAKGGSTDSDILYSVSGGANLAVTGAGTELYVPTGYSYVPGGDVTTPNMKSFGTFDGGSGTTDINGTLSMSAGNFTATSGTISIAGNFVHSGGTFSHNTGTVTLDGTGQSISGLTIFNNLTKTVTSADTLTFEAGSTQTIAGTVSLKGADGNLLSLVSGTPDTRWNFTLTAGAAKDISYVNVQDSDASGSDATQKPINPSNSLDGGNTIDWFVSGITGVVFEDVDGDANMADGQPRSGVSVNLFRDGGDGVANGSDDSLVVTTNTDGSGAYSFTSLSSGTYWVMVDSKTITPFAGFNAGFNQGDVWADQTYGDDPTTASLDVGARFGGRSGGVSDNASSMGTAQHIARVDMAGNDVSGVDFGFSFNVVTNSRGGDNTDDDGSADRTIQGSFRQFLQNANAVAGDNAMRFVPAVAANASGGGGQWWQVAVSVDLPDILDANTTLDGTAYNFSDGTTLRDANPGTLGSGGTVGVDALALTTVNRPEFEILDINNRNIGLDVQASTATIRRLSISGFGDAQNNDGEANIRVNEVTSTLIEECVIGTNAGSFTAPAEVDTADNIRARMGGSGTIRNNLIGFSGGNGISVKENTVGWLIVGNEIRGNAHQNAELNGISFEKSNGMTIRGNLIAGSNGAGVDMKDSTGSNTFENNTVTGNGTGTVETPGIRIFGTGSTIDRNIIYENFGAGVLLTTAATQNTITQNSIYDNGTIGATSGQIGIDLTSGGDQKAGDSPFVTLNDSGDGDSGGNGLLNYPVLETATTSGGNLILTGFARPGSVIELFIADGDPSGFGEGKTYLTTLTEGSASDLDGTTGSYGPGPINNLNQGSDTTNRFRFEIPLPAGVSSGTLLTATATLGNSTSEFSGQVAVDPPGIFGVVYEDPNGDADLADGQPRTNVTVTLYRDGGDGLADGGDDSVVISTTTDGSGNYSFTALGSGTYWVIVDSKEILPSAGYTGGSDQEDVWAVQAYGPTGALCADGSGGTSERGSAGVCYGGRQGSVSDNASALASAQHVARVQLSSADVTGVDFGFSFNVVTNTRGGDNTDDDGSADRTIQGSLRQFIQNANAISGANAMRFVPAVATNASGGGGSWWQVAVSVDLPDILDANTTLDGTAYNFSDGTTLRDANPGTLGGGGTVGVDTLALATVNRPEFEILDSNNKNIGLDVQAANTTIRHLAIYGFGDAQNNDGEANILVGEVSGTVIEACVIGTNPTSFTAPAEVDTADNIRARKGGSGTIRNNLIGFSGGNGISIKENSVGWLIVGNEIRGNAHQNAELNGISFEKSNGMTIRGNLIVDSNGAGADMKDSTGSNTFENNTMTGNGTGTVETPGLRIFGSSNMVDRNILYENYGAGVMVTKDATQNTITQNSIYDNGTVGAGSGQIGIDLLAGGNDDKKGTSPFVTLNDSGDGDSGGNGLLNYPILETAEITGAGLVLTGFARPGSVIEFFIADPDPSGFGEGKTYLTTLTEGLGDDLDNTTGSYGPGPINGLSQGQDTTNRFRFEIFPMPAGISLGTILTATATLGGATSEFSGIVTVSGIQLPDIVMLKSVQTFSDPVNGESNPKAIPGAVMLYTITATNQGDGATDADTVFITDPISANAELFVGDIDGPGPAAGPVLFTDGTPPNDSGLTYTFIANDDLTDDVAFSIDGTNYDYIPVPDADGFDTNITHMRVNPKGTFNGASGGNAPGFEVKFKVRVE